MNKTNPYRIFSLGDSALTVDFGNVIDENINKKVISLFKSIQNAPLAGMIEAIPAYSSLSIIYDPLIIKKMYSKELDAFEWMKNEINNFLLHAMDSIEERPDSIKIPVCYDEEFGTDLKFIAEQKNLTNEEIIHLHTSKKYRIYMLGFLPGFPYMGEIDEKIVMPRKSQPMMVMQGSVAIAGKQTGIYSLTSPGGWNIIGRTPLQLFNPAKEYPVLLKAGDTVEFYSINKEEFLKFDHEHSHH